MVELDNRTIDQELEQRYKAVAKRRLFWKLDRRLMPLLILLEVSSFIDRGTVAHIKIMGIGRDLQMSQADQDWIISIFYLAYLIFTLPSIILLRLIGPTLYLSVSIVAWGSLTIGMAFVTSARDLLIVRFFLGMAIAGFFPGMITYFSLWYRKEEQTMRITILYSAAIFACAISSLLAQGIERLDGFAGLEGWQWTFVVEGAPDILVGIITFFFLGSIPNTVQWLNNCEKDLLTNHLRDDMSIDTSEFLSGIRLSWPQVRRAFTDWRIYLYVMIGICNWAITEFLTMHLPTMLESMGQPAATIHFLTAPVYGCACAFCLLVGYSSFRRKEISFHLVFCQLFSLLGFILTLALSNSGSTALFISICIACSGAFGACPLVLSWLTKNVGGHTKRTIAIGLVLCLCQGPGIVAPQVYPDADKPAYLRGHITCIGLTVIGIVLTLVLRFSLKLENQRRKNLSVNQRNREASLKEPCDRHPDVRYFY